MRNFLLATSALGIAAGFAVPASAAADGPYVGVEGGVTLPQSTDLDVVLNHGTTTTDYSNGYRTKYKPGYDVDVIAGYKLGLLRLEAEGGYKRANVKSLSVSTPLLTAVGTAAGTTVTDADFTVGNHIGITSLMGNALLDFGGPKLGAYVGGGVGRAWTSMASGKDNAWAYQGIAGVRTAVSNNVDVGLKYRYFRTGALNFDDAFAVNGQNFTTSRTGHYSSNSLLASLAYNFNSPTAALAPLPAAQPAPPPVEALPQTQTCPDGSVILATSMCAAPPPPPPPAPAPVERGERGR